MRALLSPIWPWLAAVGAVLAAAIGIHRAGRSSGISDTTQKQKEEDHARARQIEEAATRARLDAGAVMLSASCAMQGGSETERSICRELRADLPSYSRQDTAQTLEEGARFQLVFAGVCG